MARATTATNGIAPFAAIMDGLTGAPQNPDLRGNPWCHRHHLSTTALPPGATRLEVWRVGPGAMPELLLTVGPEMTSVTIPATITFTPGGLYPLWLVAINSKGKGKSPAA